MEPFYKLCGKSEFALVHADFAVIECLLQDDRTWGAKVLEQSGEIPYRVKLVQIQNTIWVRCGIIPQSSEHFIAAGLLGRRSFLAYSIDKQKDGCTRITPTGFIPRWARLFSAVPLALMGVVPVVLSPLIWKWHEALTLRRSKLYLPAFCLYLRERLVGSASYKEGGEIHELKTSTPSRING